MKQKLITEKCTVEGTDPWGRTATMTFHPLPEGMMGQYLLSEGTNDLIPFRALETKVCWPHNIGFFPKGEPPKKVIEHMMVLKMLGYNFAFSSSGVWLPHMRTAKVETQLKPFSKVLDADIGYFEIEESASAKRKDGWMNRTNVIPES